MLKPGEVAPGDSLGTAQTWTNKTTQTWPAVSGATSYTVYRGVLADLPQLLNFSTDSCLKYTGSSTNTSAMTEDPSTGVAGRFYWYLVTGSNGAGEGPAGNATGGIARIVNSTGPCP